MSRYDIRYDQLLLPCSWGDSIWLRPGLSQLGENNLIGQREFSQTVLLVQTMYESLLFKDHTSDLVSFIPITTNHEYLTLLQSILQNNLVMIQIFSHASGWIVMKC